MKLLSSRIFLAFVLAVVLSACEKSAPAPVVSAPEVKTNTASLQDLMVAIVDPAADSLWAAVGTELTKDGPVDKQPQSDEAWAAVRQQAITLVESANLLLLPGRAVVTGGREVEDAHVPGIYSAKDIEQAIAKDKSGYGKAVQGFRHASELALKAVDARDIPGLLDAGGQLQQACESCHVQFWYPNARKPPN